MGARFATRRSEGRGVRTSSTGGVRPASTVTPSGGVESSGSDPASVPHGTGEASPIRRGLSLSAGLEQDGVALGRSAPDRGSARLGTRLGLLGIWRCRQRIAQDLSDPDGQPAAQAQARELSASTELLGDVDADVGDETRTSPPFDPTPPPERPSGLAEFTSAGYIMFPPFTSTHTHFFLSLHTPFWGVDFGGPRVRRVCASCPPLHLPPEPLRGMPVLHLYTPPPPHPRIPTPRA